MAKENGLGATLSVDSSDTTARAIGNDVTNLTFNITRGEQDVTGINKSAHERLQLLADFSTSITAVFNDAAGASSFNVFKDIGSTSVARTVSFALSGQTLNNECVFSDAAWSRPMSGEFTVAVSGALQDGTTPTWS